MKQNTVRRRSDIRSETKSSVLCDCNRGKQLLYYSIGQQCKDETNAKRSQMILTGKKIKIESVCSITNPDGLCKQRVGSMTVKNCKIVIKPIERKKMLETMKNMEKMKISTPVKISTAKISTAKISTAKISATAAAAAGEKRSKNENDSTTSQSYCEITKTKMKIKKRKLNKDKEQFTLKPAKWKTNSHVQMVKAILLEYGGRLSFQDMLQYMRNEYQSGESSILVLHAIQLALNKKIIYPYQNSFVTKEMLKVLEEEGSVEEERGEREVSTPQRKKYRQRERYSYRIMKRQVHEQEPKVPP